MPVMPPMASREFLSNRYDHYRTLRDHFPHYQTEIDGEPTLVFTRYADVVALLKSPLVTVQREPGTFPDDVIGDGPAARFVRESLVSMDAPDHANYRRIMAPAFAPGPVQKMRAWIESVCERRLAELDGRADVDFMADFASPVAADVASGLAHAPIDVGRRILAKAHELMPILGGSNKTPALLATAHDAGAFCYAQMEEVLKRLQDLELPPDDTAAVLLAAGRSDACMTASRLVTLLLGYMMASYHTTKITLGNAVVALLQHPEQKARLIEAPELASKAWEETLRYDGAVHFMRRYACKPIKIGSYTIQEGRRLLLGLQPANRDERAFVEPDRFMIERPHNRHLGFGSGSHFCLGLQVARLEGEIALRTFFRRYPHAQIVSMERFVDDITFPMLTRLTLSLH